MTMSLPGLSWEMQYLELLKEILFEGVEITNDRTGVGTYSVFGRMLKIDLAQGFPAMTTKKLFWKGVVVENQWFMSGETNVKRLQENGVRIWDEWATPGGNLGPVYGAQLRAWQWTGGGEIDQVTELLENLMKRPFSRRHVMTAWNPGYLPDESVKPQGNVENGLMALAPCHAVAIQFRVRPGRNGAPNRLDCAMYQRSCDVFLGVPFNIAGYALLTHVFAEICGYQVGELTWMGGDVHLYSNHRAQALEQLRRAPRQEPRLSMPRITSLDDFINAPPDDFFLDGYNSWPAIKGEVAV